MSVKDWVIAQNKDPAIREIKYLINNKRLKGRKVYSQDLQIVKQYIREHSQLVLCGGPIQMGYPIKERLKCFTVSDSQNYQKKALQGCHDDIGHGN